jgi:cytochrome c-type biogenesis protein CcmE
MKSKKLKRFITILCSILLTVSCNSSGGGGGKVAGGGIGGSGVISSGRITAFGSVEVNGTNFDTSNAEIIINGVEIGVGDDFVPDNLELGMVVTVEGRIEDDERFVADRVIYNANVIGPVEDISDIDATTKEIVVLGQTVIVNVVTLFEGTDFNAIAEDDVVAVSGYFDDTGIIRATFLEKTGDITSVLEFEVTGFVEDLDPDLETFMINDLIIDYSLISDELPDGIPADDQFVEVQGELVAGEIIAETIELADELDGEDGDEVEIMGFVTEVISVNDIIKFKIGNQEVHVDSDPETVIYVDGAPSDITPGQLLSAEGSLEDGILVAVEIEFWEPDQTEVEGIVDQVVFIDIDGELFPEFTLEGREDQVVQTDADTVFEDIDKEEIEAGINIEVKGVPQDIEQSVIKADKVSFEED